MSNFSDTASEIGNSIASFTNPIIGGTTSTTTTTAAPSNNNAIVAVVVVVVICLVGFLMFGKKEKPKPTV